MRILITNDDGIQSPILPYFAEWASSFGEVTVIAPLVEQSGMSHAINFTRPHDITRVELIPGVEAYSMTSTPADCVRFAVLGMKREFDLVLSGINRGFNLGLDIVYSGTAGAIFEAGRLGIPGIAISTEPKSFEYAKEKLDTVYRYFCEHSLLSENSLYNVNIPKGDGKIRITRQGGIYFHDVFEHRGGDTYVQSGDVIHESGGDLTLDTDAVREGYISITPLTRERTALDVFHRLYGKI